MINVLHNVISTGYNSIECLQYDTQGKQQLNVECLFLTVLFYTLLLDYGI